MLAVVAVLAFGSAYTHAQGIFDTFGPGNTFDTAHTWLVMDRPGSGYQAIAMRFQSLLDQQFTKAVVATSAWPYTEGYTGAMIARLIEGNDSAPGGLILEQFYFGSPYGPTVITFTSASRPSLKAGGTYWFALLPDTSAYPWQTYCGWHWSPSVFTAPSNLAVKQSSGGPWVAMGTPQGTPVAAPALRIEAIACPAWLPIDFDRDCDVDADDLARFKSCVSGPAVQHNGSLTCQLVDFDHDGDVDQHDFGRFQRCLTASPIDPGCAN